MYFKYAFVQFLDCLKMKNVFLLLGILSIVVDYTLTEAAQQTDTTYVVYGGNIITMDDNNTTTDTLVFKNGVITDIGSTEGQDISGAVWINLEGRTAMPGFIEPHTHPDLAAIMSHPQVFQAGYIDGAPQNLNTPYDGQKSYYRDLHDRLISKIDSLDSLKVIDPIKKSLLIFGWDPLFYGDTAKHDTLTNLPWLDDPKSTPAEVIDSVLGSDIPIAILLQSMHTIYTNSKWMKLYRLTEKKCDSLGLYCLKDSANQPIGRFEEAKGVAAAAGEFIASIFADDLFNERMADVIKSYHEVGISTIGVMGTSSEALDWLKSASDINRLRMRVFLNGKVKEGKSNTFSIFPQKIIDDIGQNELVTVIGKKFWYDGAPYTGSMYLDSAEANYYRVTWLTKQLGIPQYASFYGSDSNKNFGHSNFPGTKNQNDFKTAIASVPDTQIVAVHAQGGQAGSDVLKFFNEIYNENPHPPHGSDTTRFRLEHNGFIDTTLLGNLGKLPIHMSFHMLHIYWYGADFGQLFNEATINHVMPTNTAVAQGIPFSFHTDTPMYPPNPLLTVRTAVTRKTYKTNQPFDNKGIDVKSALRAVTINAAKGLNLDKQIGSLEVGKKADIVILESNPLTISSDSLHTIRISELWLEGEKVYYAK